MRYVQSGFLLVSCLLALLISLTGCTMTGSPSHSEIPSSPTPVFAEVTMSEPLATEADLALIQEALTTTQQLHSYHFTLTSQSETTPRGNGAMVVTGGFISLDSDQLPITGWPVAGNGGPTEGDYIAPDQACWRFATRSPNAELIRGDQVFIPDAHNAWILAQSDDMLMGIPGRVVTETSPVSGTVQQRTILQPEANILQRWRTSVTTQPRYSAVGTIQDQGVLLRQFRGIIPAPETPTPEAGTPPLMEWGEGQVTWGIDPQTRYVHRFVQQWTWTMNMGEIEETPDLGDLFPSRITVTETLTLVLSQHNDPNIVIPHP